jgi:hypothetical protein
MPMILASSTRLPPSLSPSFFLQNFKVAAILLDLGAFQLVLLSSRVYFDHLADLLFQFLELSRNRVNGSAFDLDLEAEAEAARIFHDWMFLEGHIHA